MSEERRSSIHRLRESLSDRGKSTDIEMQARSVLGYVLDPILEGETASEAMPVPYDVDTCPNCGTPTASSKTPYCSENCREIAGFVRQLRTGLTLGWISEPDKQVALGQVLWHASGGGRPLRLEIAPARAKEKALKVQDSRCQVCGAPATTLDHIGSGCNRPTNLRAVCGACCTDRAFGDPKITQTETFAQTTHDLAQRIGSDQPLRCCDEDAWDWREYLKARKAAQAVSGTGART